MYKIAFVLGKQGSGKSTRICASIRKKLFFWNVWHKLHLRPRRIYLSKNCFNHLHINDVNEVELIYSIRRNREKFKLKELPHGVHIIELPHSGYFPLNSNNLFNTETLCSRIFAIELPEPVWRSIGGETGDMTSPEYFMKKGRSITSRSKCDYQLDINRIRNDIHNSGVPAKFFTSAHEMVNSIREFVLGIQGNEF